jgi:hypothetical protein
LGTIIRAGQTLFTTFAELRQWRPDLELVLACLDSAKAASVLPESDVVFVDAGHGYQSVAADIQCWRPKCRLLCGHDFNEKDWPEVVSAVRKYFPTVANPVGSIWSIESVRVL